VWYIDPVKKVKQSDLERLSRRQTQAKFPPGTMLVLSPRGNDSDGVWMVIAYVQTPPKLGTRKQIIHARDWEAMLISSSHDMGMKNVGWWHLSTNGMTLDEYEDWMTTP
jgi:hypothetical protein